MKGDLLGIRVSALIPHHWEMGVMVHFHHWVEVLALKEPAPVSKVQCPHVKMPEVCPLTEAGGPGACSIYGFRPLVPGMTMVPYAQPPFQESTLHRGESSEPVHADQHKGPWNKRAGHGAFSVVPVW